MDKLLIKRGSKRALEQLDPLQVGELFLAKDEERLYVGGPRGNISIPIQKDLDEKHQEVITQLDEKHQEVITQLNQIEKEVDEKATKTELQQVSLAYKESYDTLDDLKKAYPNGDVYNHVVLADGMIYTYAKGEWISTGVVANGAIEFMKAYEDLKVLEIGGRNLLKNSRLIRLFSNNPSNFPISYTLMTEGKRQFYRIVRTNTQSYPTRMSLYNSIPVTDITQDLFGQTVTFSFRARASHNVDSNLYFRFDGGSNGTKVMDYHESTFQITTSWKTYSFTVTIDFSIYNSELLRFTPWQITIPDGEIDNFYLDICEFKIELGNRATDWTPAPEDIDAHPFVVELAETVFRSKQNEERIRNLEEKLISN